MSTTKTGNIPPERHALHELAGEYVLGTLSAARRREVEARLADDLQLQAAVHAWEDRLLPLTGLVEPVAPSPRLWARIERSLDALAVLRATFPAGTVSGAPKLRAMEIIDELEPTKRGIYAGSAGYIGFHGDMDLAIAIRTAVVKDGMIHVQAGAGIVADSDPAAEWQETQSKARAALRAAEIAEAGLDTRL